MKRYTDEFTPEQESRIDEVENAVYEMCLVLTERVAGSPTDKGEGILPWNVNYIGEIADFAEAILTKNGYRVRYPAHTTDSNNRDVVIDYMDEV